MPTRLLSIISVSVLILMVGNACEVFSEPDVSNDVVTILSPSEGSQITSNPVLIWWDYTFGCVEYELQVVTPSFENPISLSLDTIISYNKFQIELDTGIYELRVRGLNYSTSTSYFERGFSVNMN